MPVTALTAPNKGKSWDFVWRLNIVVLDGYTILALSNIVGINFALYVKSVWNIARKDYTRAWASIRMIRYYNVIVCSCAVRRVLRSIFSWSGTGKHDFLSWANMFWICSIPGMQVKISNTDSLVFPCNVGLG